MSSYISRCIAGLLIAAGSLSAPAMADESPLHWGYEKIVTADDWAELAPACSGALQSPIDLRPGTAAHGTLHALHVDSPALRFSVLNNGHTLEASPLPGQHGGVTIDGERYALLQFHVHTPSEHFVNGKPHAMELHMVHTSKSGKTAVVAVFFDVGTSSSVLSELFERLPSELTTPGMALALRDPLDLGSLLPPSPAGIRYVGSLTTPPCTEGVLWNIELTPQTISQEQLDALRSVYPHNSRPLQSFNAREVSEESFD